LLNGNASFFTAICLAPYVAKAGLKVDKLYGDFGDSVMTVAWAVSQWNWSVQPKELINRAAACGFSQCHI